MNFFELLSVDTITDIAKMLDQKSLCRLIMSSKEFKQLCDTNDIWKYHYLVTLRSKMKITENSIHIKYGDGSIFYEYIFTDDDGCSTRCISQSSPSESKILVKHYYYSRYAYVDRKKFKYIGIYQGQDPYIASLWTSIRSDDNIIKCGCMSHQFNLIKSSGIVQSRQNDQCYYEWKKDIKGKWKKLNEQNGLQNLCQNPSHYLLESLEMPESCKSYKNYKKMIIKKLYTQCKNTKEDRKYITKNIKLDREMERLRMRYKQLEKEKKMNEDSIIKSRKKLDRLKDAIDIA